MLVAVIYLIVWTINPLFFFQFLIIRNDRLITPYLIIHCFVGSTTGFNLNHGHIILNFYRAFYGYFKRYFRLFIFCFLLNINCKIIFLFNKIIIFLQKLVLRYYLTFVDIKSVREGYLSLRWIGLSRDNRLLSHILCDNNV